MPFDPQRALDYARALAFPRRVGTPGEAAATQAVTDRLTSFGYAVERQPFECSTGAEAAFALLIGLGQVLVILTFWAYSGPPGLALLPAAALALLLINANRVSRWAAAGVLAPNAGVWQRGLGRLGRRYATVNLIARSAAVRPDAPHLFLMAHWDSKSQALPLAVRMGLMTLAGAAGSAFAALSLLRLVWPDVTSLAALCGLLALVSAVPVLLLYLVGSGNASPGAVDNASGLGLLLHLAEHLRAEPPGMAVTFLATGAEEFGVLGAAAYVQAAQARGEFQPAARLHVLNLDGVGADGPLAYVAAEATPLTGLVRAACKALGLSIGRLPLMGAMFDHLPFADAGLDALSLVSTGRATHSAHTPADSADKLSLAGFGRAGEVVLQVVQQLLAAERGQA